MPKVLALCLALLLLVAASEQDTIGVKNCTDHFRTNARTFAKRVTEMRIAMEQIDSTDAQSIADARQKLKSARLAYKSIAFFLDYFFFTSSRIYNRPPKTEIEEPHLEYGAPTGLQYIEALLFENAGLHKAEILQQCRLLETSAEDLPALLYEFKASDGQVLEAARLELVRIVTLNITGFDAPLLKSGLEESLVSLFVLYDALRPYLEHSKNRRVPQLIEGCVAYISKNNDFDTFDRMHFLTRYALPLQEELGHMITGMDLKINEKSSLNYNSKHLFDPDAFTPDAFGIGNRDAVLAELGEKLFFEVRLSSNGTRSCASCHNPALHFTDGLPQSIGIHPGQAVRRNAPSLFYSAFQHAQFWDGRARTLEEQVRTVIHDSLEMNGQPSKTIRELTRDRSYRRLIRKVAPGHKSLDDSIIYKSIAAYIRTLRPFNSDFDRYVAGDTTALTDRQINGFNLFMGKAQCATCHFAPLFNGLIPPTYTLTEFEILGTTTTDDFLHPVASPDQGRYETRPTPYYRGAFKTPTVRNAAVTAPYMHNGALSSLEKVMEFYDKGGGAGLGLDIPDQTLPATPLNLSEEEKSDIIAFLHSLTDRL